MTPWRLQPPPRWKLGRVSAPPLQILLSGSSISHEMTSSTLNTAKFSVSPIGYINLVLATADRDFSATAISGSRYLHKK